MKNSFISIVLIGILSLISCKKKDDDLSASFTYTTDGLNIALNNTSSGSYSSANWDYGDGTTGTSLTHTYANDSTYTVTLTIKNDMNEDAAQESIVVAELLDLIQVTTDFGSFIFWLYDETPLHKENFLSLAREEFFDSTTFHRIVDDFVIQGGDPNTKDEDPSNDGTGGPGYEIDAEILPELSHVYGAIGAARNDDGVNPERRSNGSQFYVVENINGTPFLDGQYTVFGIVIDGMRVVETIASQPNSGTPNNRPSEAITMDIDIVRFSRSQLREEYNFEMN